MKANKRRQSLIYIVAFGCVMAMMVLLWREDFLSFYTVLIGAAYFYLDRVHEKEDKQ